MSAPSCANARLIDAHFEGTITPSDEHAMREHVQTCGACRERYERQLLFASLAPDATPAIDRIGRGLGVSTRKPSAIRRAGPWAFAAAAAAAVALLVGRPTSDGAFTARGGSSANIAEAPTAPVLHVYRTGSADDVRRAPLPVVSTIDRGDALAFALENRDHKKYAMIFGVSDSGRVYWFYPAWADARDNPRAIPIAPDPALHELPDAITHRFEGARLHVHALFLDDALSVHEIEALSGAPDAPRVVQGGVDHVMTLALAP